MLWRALSFTRAFAQGHKTGRILTVAGAVAALVGVVLLFLFDPTTANFYPRCPFYVLTGLKCPGCGTLRGIHALLHFRFVDAFWFNPLMVVSIPLIVLFLALPRSCKSVWVSRSVLIVILLYWILRNI